MKKIQLDPETLKKYSDLRIVLIDSEETINYATFDLPKYNEFGVDLEGDLNKNGSIDLL